MTIVVIGRSGQVARAVVDRARLSNVPLRVLGRPEFDLERPEAVTDVIVKLSPSVIINAAAYTAVDKAESEVEKARCVNAISAAAIAAAAPHAAFIQVSTDYVFSGAKPGAYTEDDPAEPTGVYGASKLEGERLVQEANMQALIVRTSWVFDASGTNFVRKMLQLARVRSEVDVVADQMGCPTFADDLADAILAIATRPAGFGVYHCAGSGEATWADFAEEIFKQSRALGGPAAQVRRVSSADFATRAKRPANSRLDCTKLATKYGIRLRPWRDALADCLYKMAKDGWSV